MSKYLGNFVPFIAVNENVGNSTSLVNFSSSIADHGKKVIIVDFSHNNSPHSLLNLDIRVLFDFNDFLKGNVPLQKITIPFKKNRNLAFFPNNSSLKNIINDTKKMSAFIDILRERYDYIFFDVPHSFLPDIHTIFNLADDFIIVSDFEQNNLVACSEISEEFLSNEIPFRFLLNKYDPTSGISLSNISKSLHNMLLGAINFQPFELASAAMDFEPAYFNKGIDYSHTIDKIANRYFNNEFLNPETNSDSFIDDSVYKKIFNQNSYFKLS